MPESQIKVEYNYHCGDDLAVVNAARRSFGAKSDWDYQTTSVTNYDVGSGEEIYTYIDKTKPTLKPKDKKLLEFLARGMSTDDWEQFKMDIGNDGLMWLYYMDNNMESDLVDKLWQWRNTPTHDTPFNHCFISFDVAAPIFVRAQLVKHEYLIMSEFSRRYKTEDIEFYEHEYRKAPLDKKQGSGGTHSYSGDWQKSVREHNFKTLDLYQSMVGDCVAPEQARGVLPQSLMTSWTWSGTLGAFAKMCQLRLDPHAQYETRLVAHKVYDYLKEHFPVSAPLLVEGVK